MTEYKRGDIVWYDAQFMAGSVQHGRHPYLIISNDIGNKYSPTVILAAITSQNKKYIPTHFMLDCSCGLKRPSTVMMEQIITVNKTDISEIIGHANMDLIDRSLAISLGLPVTTSVKWGQIVCA